MQRLASISHLSENGWSRTVFFLGIGLNLFLQSATGEELIEPHVCSAATVGQPPLIGLCAVTPLGKGHNEVKVDLTAKTASIDVAGYKVITENYNGNYLTPVIEVMPGDTVAAHLANILAPRPHDGMTHGDADKNPTNLHYFHGGIVSPNNSRPKNVELGNGDNIYVHLRAGRNAKGVANSFDFDVPIPGEQMLDARVLEGTGYISHPVGLNWYHSHMHGISSDQVMGGMSGLLSVGNATANVKAACREDPNNKSKCLNDVEKDTADLRGTTKVRYALLRDLPLQKISKRPEDADGATADWDTTAAARDFSIGKPLCGVWRRDDSGLDVDDKKIRTGFCQRDRDSALLFTVNGQRFPTITIEGSRNLLLRLGNLSANVPYWLELSNEADGTVLPLTVLSLDGVVPARPVDPGQEEKPVEATNYDNLLLMPAARAEIYLRNDGKPHAASQVYVLRTKGFQEGTDEWPEIQLARIVLEPNAVASTIAVALNAPIATGSNLLAPMALNEKTTLPDGCVRDLDAAFHEYRRVTFIPGGQTSDGMKMDWSVLTQIVRPPVGPDLMDEALLTPENPKETSVGVDRDGNEQGVPFEEYVQKDGSVDWMKRHVCVLIDHGAHQGSHKQLWVLVNATGTLHNFHIHQMKFRLATRKELEEFHIRPPNPSHTCDPGAGACTGPDYNFYNDQAPADIDPKGTALWHDTIPLPPFMTVFTVMSFDAKQQIGRFVFHCHILKHEDKGLMAPIEVWEPTTGTTMQ